MIIEDSNLPSVAKSNSLIPAVAIGAAEGGVEAISMLLQHLPNNTGLAYFYVQYPEDGVGTPELISQMSGITELQVVEGMEGLQVQPDHLYVLPPGNPLFLQDDILSSRDKPKNVKSHLPINSFFTALAESYKERAIGILLSGSLSDGVLGMKAIKLAGGLTFVQDRSAQFQTMSK
ncbi:MAG TPA: chemotaxis protein CheB, partial [Flavisolibacter sp.]